MENACASDEADAHSKCDHGSTRRGRKDHVIHGKHINVQYVVAPKIFISDFGDVCSRKSLIH